ncbi:MAG: CapA family protein [Minisyncoccales bacterium]
MKIKSFKIIIIGVIFLVAAGLFAAKIKYLSDGEAVRTANVAIDENNTAQREKQEKAAVEILAFGDLLLDRYIKLYIDRQGEDYPFENIKEIFAGNDIVMANLEGSFTDFAPWPLDPDNTSFTFNPELAAMLKQTGFNLVNLANNHVQDFGRDGFAQSRACLEQNSIDHFGDYYNESPALVKEINGQKIAFVGYHSLADPATAGTIEKIKQAHEIADYIIVYTHWGAEYQNDFSKSQQAAGREFIDVGADAVLGSHPHVIQPVEIYKNKAIFYSLGNFLFDQIFSFEVRHGLGVKITFASNKIEYEMIPTQMKNFQVVPPDEAAKTLILQNLSAKSVASDGIKAQISSGKFTLPDN